jgi:membrane peptidoglycan carboxypeptidase
MKDRVVAAKTGTSDKDVTKGKGEKILPRDLWTAGYTPQITTVVWAGNVDGSETKGT